jgi:hypothetical protein
MARRQVERDRAEWLILNLLSNFFTQRRPRFGAGSMGFRLRNRHAIVLVAELGNPGVNDFTDTIDLTEWSRFRASMPRIKTHIFTKRILLV